MTLPAALLERQQLDETLATALSAADWEWQRMIRRGEPLAAWDAGGQRLTEVVDTARVLAATQGRDSVPRLLAAQGLSPEAEGLFRPVMLSGWSSEGWALDMLMFQAIRAIQSAMEAGASFLEALPAGASFVQRAVSTQVADAYRTGSGAQSVASPAAALMVRVVNHGACSRCVVLAGKTSHTREAFLRHPQCRCINIPAGENVAADVGTDPREYFDSLSEAEQNRTFTVAGAQAIRDGADMGQVINARAGMSSSVDSQGQRLVSTRSGMSRRGYAYGVMSRNPDFSVAVGDSSTRRRVTELRLMPESIYDMARDREDAVRLLKLYGYF